MGCWGARRPGTERANLWGAVSVKPSWSRGALALVSFWVGRFGLEQGGLLARSHQGKISEGGGAAASLEAQESFGLEKSSLSPTVTRSGMLFPPWSPLRPLLRRIRSSPSSQAERSPAPPSLERGEGAESQRWVIHPELIPFACEPAAFPSRDESRGVGTSVFVSPPSCVVCSHPAPSRCLFLPVQSPAAETSGTWVLPAQPWGFPALPRVDFQHPASAEGEGNVTAPSPALSAARVRWDAVCCQHAGL